MTQTQGILVASDLSEQSALALQRAALQAHELGAPLEILHVLEVTPPDFPCPEEQNAASCGGLSDTVLKRLREQAGREIPEGVQYQCRVEAGKAFVTIIRTARRMQVRCIVVAAHGRHFLRALFLGTTVEKVVRKSELPVLVVKKAPRGPYRRVLVPTDFSAAAGQALLAVRMLVPDAHIDLLHVYTLWGEEYQTPSLIKDAARERYQQEMLRRAASAMAAWLKDLGLDQHRVKQHIYHGRPATLIPMVAKKLAVDLVAMGTTGRSGLSHVLLGSVAEHVLWQAPCDLLTVRPSGFHFELP
jgi:nucleotide-binding universal stress UspA family protein